MENRSEDQQREAPPGTPAEVAMRVGAAMLMGLCSAPSAPPALRAECEARLGRDMLALARSEGQAAKLPQVRPCEVPELAREAVEAVGAGMKPGDVAFCLDVPVWFVTEALGDGLRADDAPPVPWQWAAE